MLACLLLEYGLKQTSLSRVWQSLIIALSRANLGKLAKIKEQTVNRLVLPLFRPGVQTRL